MCPQPGDVEETPGKTAAAVLRVKQVLERLPQRYALVLELRFLQRMTVAETATRMGISHGNAKILQYRALRKAALIGEPTDG